MTEKQSHQHASRCGLGGCCLSVGRREFMTTVGLSALAANSALTSIGAAMESGGDEKPKCHVRAVFVRPDVKEYWMGWPGASYDIAARQQQYTKLMTDAAAEEDIDLKVTAEPVATAEDVNALVAELKQSPPDGVIVCSQSLNHSWPHINRFVAERPADVPVIVFSPMGTSFTGHLQGTRDKSKTLVAATQQLDWLAEGVHLLATIHGMKHSRLLFIHRDKAEEQTLDVIGTTLCHVRRDRWLEAEKAVGDTAEMERLAAELKERSKKIVEPNEKDIYRAAKNYFIAKRLMAEENCDGISLDCLGLVGERKIKCPPCIAWMMLNDEASVGCCERDWNAAISLRLCALLTGRPGFMQDPCPNTINGSLMGAHCSSPTKLRGFDQLSEPLILRSHSESTLGVSPQVIWPLDEKVTVMKFTGPRKMIIGTGKVISNIDTPPAGGCRTSVELAMEDKPDPRDCAGFHQLFILGDHAKLLERYCQLAGIEAAPV